MKRNLEEQGAQFLEAQRLAFRAVREVSKHLKEGWTEIQAARMINTYLADFGVRSQFHHAFAWFGERSGFEGIKTYQDFMPSSRVLLPGDVYILDVAPIVRGFVSDIGFTGSLGKNEELEKAMDLLLSFRSEIPSLFKNASNGGEVWKAIEKKIIDHGYTNAYKKYPFSVLGHRVHKVPKGGSFLKVMNFGWQSYWSLASRGIFSQLLRENSKRPLAGFWAIEPHLSAKTFGAKFEEILVVTPTEAYWLDNQCLWKSEAHA